MSDCPICDEAVGTFRDEASQREASTSGMCQGCQDAYFGKEAQTHSGPHAGDPTGTYEDPVGGSHPYNKWHTEPASVPAEHPLTCSECGFTGWSPEEDQEYDEEGELADEDAGNWTSKFCPGCGKHYEQTGVPATTEELESEDNGFISPELFKKRFGKTASTEGTLPQWIKNSYV